VEGLSFGPETMRVFVMGTVSGVALLSEQELPGIDPVALDCDTGGRIFVADGSTGAIVRVEKDGANPYEAGRVEGKRPSGLAVNSTSGDLFVALEGSPSLKTISKRRRAAEAITGPGPLGTLRFQGSDLYAAAGGLHRLVDLKLTSAYAKGVRAGRIASFDLDAIALWALLEEDGSTQLFRIDSKGNRDGVGAPTGIARLDRPAHVRLDGEGSGWVVDSPIEAPQRVLIFSRKGEFVRAFRLPDASSRVVDLARGVRRRMAAVTASQPGVPARILRFVGF
ncbi:MAG: hypothetical protein ABIT01_13690, partial [Thermoanaerobaculia bacterium]